MIYGYCRISTKSQSLDRQELNIVKAYPEASIYKEAFTGTTMERPVWKRLLKLLKPGDTIVFDSVSRMSRDSEEGWECYQQLYSKGVDLVFLKEPHINTAVYRKALQNSIPLTGTSVDLILQGVNAYLLELAKEQIKIAFDQSEKEVQDLHKRTSEGMAASGAGEKISKARTGRTYESDKAKAAKAIIKKHHREFGGSLTTAEVLKMAGISRNTFYKYRNELREAANSSSKAAGSAKASEDFEAPVGAGEGKLTKAEAGC